MINILDYNLDELKEEFNNNEIKPFRSKQIYDWIFKKYVFDFLKMYNLSKLDKELLSKKYNILTLYCKKKIESNDKETMKFLFKTEDNHFIETVLIRSDNRNTICVSTQIGCALNCCFCATGRMGFKRDLSVSEIISQVLYVSHYVSVNNIRISNIVFMGMGEPFLNYDNLLKYVYILNDSSGYNLGARQMTISTAGVVPGIEKFSEENIQLRLAVSLNSPFQDIREKIMPFSKKHKLEELFNAIKMYQKKSNRRITFEYIMLKNINMDERHVRELKKVLSMFHYSLNIIKYNNVNNKDDLEPDSSDIQKFKSFLSKYHLKFTERFSKGSSINAGCGQLSSKNKNNIN